MWETVKDSKKSRKVLLTFFDWMENIVLRSNYFREAEDLFAKFSADISEIDLLSTTPQTPPWHAEGPFVSDHVKRMLATVMAVSGGTSLLQIEEFAVRRDFLSYIETLELTIKENAATLIAFALVHDIAKAEVLSFSADSGSLGEREKFKKNKKYLQNPASTQERLLYDKLFRAHIASRNKEPDSLGLIDFFDKYEISAHYFNHATVGASHKFDDARLAVSNGLHLTSRQGAVVKFLSRYHMDRIKTAEQFNLLIARANKAGLDGFGISDIFVAQEFLDSCCGCLHYIDAHFSIDLSVVFDFFEAE
ncbi:hypothetical protein KJ766_01520, partial [Patescibacteria group bacterium]|nr:hypothetical protein [Patescibacteria group bacterium]